MERSEISRQTLADLIDFDHLTISTHALNNFSLRTGTMTLADSIELMRNRLKTAIKIEKHERIHLKPEAGTLFFLDFEDSDTVYVIKRKNIKRSTDYVVASILRPLRAGEFQR